MKSFAIVIIVVITIGSTHSSATDDSSIKLKMKSSTILNSVINDRLNLQNQVTQETSHDIDLLTIKIDNQDNSSDLEDYQIRVDLEKDNFDFGRVDPKGHSLYFKDANNTNLPHWIESYDVTQHQARLWVKVFKIPAETISYIYLCQGDIDAGRTNGDDTFDFFDDFETLPSAWVKYGPVLTPTESWEGHMVRDPTVLVQDNQYRMWYWNDAYGVGYATSPDGVNWTKFEANPVFTNGIRPSVVFNDGVYYLYYAQDDERGIRLATSNSPTGPFDDHGMIIPPSQDWEDGFVKGPSAWYDTDEKTFKIWYSGGSISPAGVPWTEPAGIGYAVSQDGYNWTKPKSDPVMHGRGDGSWLSQGIETLRVYKKDQVYYGFFHSADYWGVSRIGMTQSSNGYEWNPQPEDLIVDLGGYGDFDSDFLYTTAPIYNDGWMFWHNGRNNDHSDPEIIGFVKLQSNVSQLDSSKWAKSRRVTVSIENSTASFKMFNGTMEYDQHDYFVWTAQQFQDGVLEARVQLPSGYVDLYSLLAIGARFDGTYHNVLINGNPSYYGDMSWYELLIGSGSLLKDTVRTGRWIKAEEYVFLPYYEQQIKRDQWYTLRLEINGNNISSFIDDQPVFSGQDSSLTQQGSLLIRILETDGIVDWVKFSKPESKKVKVNIESAMITV